MRGFAVVLISLFVAYGSVAEAKPQGTLTPLYCGENAFEGAEKSSFPICFYNVERADRVEKVLSVPGLHRVVFYSIHNFEEASGFWSMAKVEVKYDNNGNWVVQETDYMETVEISYTKTESGYQVSSDLLKLAVDLKPIKK